MRMMNYINEFWKSIKPDKGYVEIRLVPLKKQPPKDIWNNLKQLHKTLDKQVLINKQVCFFIKDVKDIEKILLFKNGYFNHNTKICYGINERFKDKNNNIGGKYTNLKNFKFLFFDIDKTQHNNIKSWERKFMIRFVKDFIIDMKNKYNLQQPIIVSSGGGYHILYRIEEVKITEGRKRWLKEWMKNIQKEYTNQMFELDAVYDATRIFSLPGSRNNKRNENVELVQSSTHINKFKIHSKQLPKIKPMELYKGSRKDAILRVLNEPLTKLLLNVKLPPEANTNNILIFQLKILLKILNFQQNDIFITKLFNKIQQKQQETYPANLPNGNINFNKNVINNYCISNKLEVLYK